NQESVDRLGIRQPGWITSALCKWTPTTFQIPIEKVKFPTAPGSGGAGPAHQLNWVTITFTDPAPDNCRLIGGASLQIRTMSPIILIHGNGQQGVFWEHHGFVQHLRDSKHLVFDNSINLSPPRGVARVADNADQLYDELRNVSSQFGVDSIHLVAHSKGGLDARKYLATHYLAKHCAGGDRDGHTCTLPSDCPYGECVERGFDVLSLTTLSTLHDGAVGADVLEMHRVNAVKAKDVEFYGIDLTRLAFSWLMSLGDNPAHQDLTTYGVEEFNGTNLGRLPRGIMYNRVAADADLNNNDKIDLPPEMVALTQDDKLLKYVYQRSPDNAIWAVDYAYQTAGKLKSIPLRPISQVLDPDYFIAEPNPATGFLPNDTLVSTKSALGELSVPSFKSIAEAPPSGGQNRIYEGPPFGRNHSNVADAGVAAQVVTWIAARERSRGDLF
ncbi:MAG: hypothetical protein JSU86_06345, partial [Phycisphaerales bacterium]